MTRRLKREPRNADVQIPGSLEIGVRTVGSSVDGAQDTLTTDAYLKLPVLTTAQRTALTPEEGMVVYDSSLGKEYVYRGSGWGASDGTAAGSLDAAYDGGGTINVDNGAVTLTDTQTDTTNGLLITKSGAVTGSDSCDVLYVNSTGAHDTTGRRSP